MLSHTQAQKYLLTLHCPKWANVFNGSASARCEVRLSGLILKNISGFGSEFDPEPGFKSKRVGCEVRTFFFILLNCLAFAQPAGRVV